MYVGLTIDGKFGTRLKKGHPAEHVGGYFGTPFLFLLYPQKGKGKKSSIKELERDLIGDAHWINQKVMNDKGTLKFDYTVRGLFPRTPGHNKIRAKFARMVGWS